MDFCEAVWIHSGGGGESRVLFPSCVLALNLLGSLRFHGAYSEVMAKTDLGECLVAHHVHILYIPCCCLCKFLTLCRTSQKSFFFRVIDKDWECRVSYTIWLWNFIQFPRLGIPLLYNRQSQTSKWNAWCILRCLARNSVSVIGLKWL